jgi:hypothetical protein
MCSAGQKLLVPCEERQEFYFMLCLITAFSIYVERNYQVKLEVQAENELYFQFLKSLYFVPQTQCEQARGHLNIVCLTRKTAHPNDRGVRFLRYAKLWVYVGLLKDYNFGSVRIYNIKFIFSKLLT